MGVGQNSFCALVNTQLKPSEIEYQPQGRRVVEVIMPEKTTRLVGVGPTGHMFETKDFPLVVDLLPLSENLVADAAFSTWAAKPGLVCTCRWLRAD